jgi:hypothetical protein
MTLDYWTVTGDCWKYIPDRTVEQLRTVKSDKTGTTKTVSLGTYTISDDFQNHCVTMGPDKIIIKAPNKGEPLGRELLTKTTFGENSTLKPLGIDSIEFATKSKDLVINQVDGKQLKACLRNPGEIDMVRGFFKILKRLK